MLCDSFVLRPSKLCHASVYFCGEQSEQMHNEMVIRTCAVQSTKIALHKSDIVEETCVFV